MKGTCPECGQVFQHHPNCPNNDQPELDLEPEAAPEPTARGIPGECSGCYYDSNIGTLCSHPIPEQSLDAPAGPCPGLRPYDIAGMPLGGSGVAA